MAPWAGGGVEDARIVHYSLLDFTIRLKIKTLFIFYLRTKNWNSKRGEKKKELTYMQLLFFRCPFGYMVRKQTCNNHHYFCLLIWDILEYGMPSQWRHSVSRLTSCTLSLLFNFQPRYFDDKTHTIISKSPRYPCGSSRKISIFTMGLYGNLLNFTYFLVFLSLRWPLAVCLVRRWSLTFVCFLTSLWPLN